MGASGKGRAPWSLAAFALAAARLLLFLTVACNPGPATVFRQWLYVLEARALCSPATGVVYCRG